MSHDLRVYTYTIISRDNGFGFGLFFSTVGRKANEQSLQ